jgi:hypothetical protein
VHQSKPQLNPPSSPSNPNPFLSAVSIQTH